MRMYKKTKEVTERLEKLLGVEIKKAVTYSKKSHFSLDKEELGENTIRNIIRLGKQIGYRVEPNGCSNIAIILKKETKNV